MSVVARRRLELALEDAKKKGTTFFGSDTVYIEKLVEKPAHVEVQILGDKLTATWSRTCTSASAPCSAVTRRCSKRRRRRASTTRLAAQDGRRRCDASRRPSGYENAGTVEMIVGGAGSTKGKFFFLEVNTRLQVEHPVTELVTGIDLVREQILIAQGQPLTFQQEDLRQNGHAVECRLYAEDADNHFLPTTGKLVDWFVPEMPGLRVDSGVEQGSEVGIHYDPMLAKVITHAPSRGEAIQKMIGALSHLSAEGLVTNREFLLRVLSHPEFRAGSTHTHFIDEHLAERPEDPKRAERERWAAVAATLAGRDHRRRDGRILPGLEPGFRNNPNRREWVEYRLADRHVRVEYAGLGSGKLAVSVDGSEHVVRDVSAEERQVSFEDEAGARRAFRVSRRADHWFVHAVGGSFTLVELPRFPEKQTSVAPGSCVAPMPGKVVKVVALEGTAVAAGDVLVVLEAMKMEHSVRAPEAGIVKQLLVSEGEQVEADAVLAIVGAAE